MHPEIFDCKWPAPRTDKQCSRSYFPINLPTNLIAFCIQITSRLKSKISGNQKWVFYLDNQNLNVYLWFLRFFTAVPQCLIEFKFMPYDWKSCSLWQQVRPYREHLRKPIRTWPERDLGKQTKQVKPIFYKSNAKKAFRH